MKTQFIAAVLTIGVSYVSYVCHAQGRNSLFRFQSTGGNETNWVPTSANGKFEVLFRFYGPEKPLFEKTWVLPDIARLK